MSSNITSILTLPEEILENKIYNYLGNDGVSLFQSTNKKTYLDHQDKASAETPLLKLNGFSLSKILGFMSLGDKLKLSRTNSTMRRKWKHEYIDLLDIINLIPIIGNIQTQMNNTQEGIITTLKNKYGSTEGLNDFINEALVNKWITEIEKIEK